eukprot:TRINITY_DN110840_c0_g1_i1.p1 TRINITY_DN110840_c0_g1~~TRINITY_DN110840_c0_g1_i1.p1  ORF type:complete len:706 (+),score=124.93 TRINITY_DN110840_c0_g1_i1:81-2198(+)
MGLLKVGKPLGWNESIPHSQYIREHGVRQFINVWKRVKNLQNDRLYYGDEIEYAVLKVDEKGRQVFLSLRGAELLDELRKREEKSQQHVRGCAWHQEYGSWMLEGTPASPYGGYTSSLVQVERNMRLRRARLLAALAEDEIAPTMVNFPLMGVNDFVYPPGKHTPGGPSSESSTVPDACINPHPRFGTLTANIRTRRQRKVDIQVPLFQDAHTQASSSKQPKVETNGNGRTKSDKSADFVNMDCMAYGMGCCCLQVTFQASDMPESRYLYDQLATLAPIFLALTAATPVYQGRLTEIDARWSVIAASVDDRTKAELGQDEQATPNAKLAGQGVRRLAKSRYDSISCYIQNRYRSKNERNYYNDVECEEDKEMFDLLEKEGLDPELAHHVAHLFVRDPLVVFDGAVSEVDDETSTEHWDSINSTNWQTVRWKPPPVQGKCDPHVGWRTEFRSMEVQFTDFENAAFTAFIVLLSRALLIFDLDLLMPLSKVDENMRRAHSMDAVNTEKFWFRRCIIPGENGAPGCRLEADANGSVQMEQEMTMNELVNGKNGHFPGLVPICESYLEHIGCDQKSMKRIRQYLDLVSGRAAGRLLTPATWMRKFVRTHPDYNQDSVVGPSIAYDLVKAVDEIGKGLKPCPEILGNVSIEPIKTDGIYATDLKGSQTSAAEARAVLLANLCARARCQDGPGSTPTCPMRERASSRDFQN